MILRNAWQTMAVRLAKHVEQLSARIEEMESGPAKMPNPFPFYAKPANWREAQSNANRSYYNLLEAQEELHAADLAW